MLLLELAERIGHEFRALGLLAEALIHPSMGNERTDSYERLEFLGDSVLQFIVTEHLFREHPRLAEGELTRLRSAIVSRDPLAASADRLGLIRYVQAGRGLSSAELRSERILANLLESVLAAVYLDGGIRAARRFVKQHVLPGADRTVAPATPRDPKTTLLHVVQAAAKGQPTYRLLDAQGPDHERTFLVAVDVGGAMLGEGSGRSKRAAERAAAEVALAALRDVAAEHDLDDHESPEP